MRPQSILIPDAALAVLVAADLAWTLRSGRARGRFGTITRRGQPKRFWRYVYSSYVVLAFCAAVFLWVLIAPQSL
ncbi:MAG TPA: hypothetical protein VKB68_17140 [Stellaceae bacterium]|nr:hypothetical protein [Stellaceae bacterium]